MNPSTSAKAIVRTALGCATAGVLVACGPGDQASRFFAPTIAAQPQPLSVREGATATFTVTADGSPPFTYQWQRDGVAIAGATSSSYSAPSATPADDGVRFSVVVRNAAGERASASAVMTVLRL
jgi:hypothetical protein